MVQHMTFQMAERITEDYYSQFCGIELSRWKQGSCFSCSAARGEKLNGFGCRYAIYILIKDDLCAAAYSPEHKTVMERLKGYDRDELIAAAGQRFKLKRMKLMMFEREAISQYGGARILRAPDYPCYEAFFRRVFPGVDPDALKAHGSSLEEARADLFALYYLADPKLVELGLLDSPDAYKAQYYHYMLNGLMTQLMRIEPGKDVEEAHMRNRKLIAEWALEKGAPDKVVELVKKDGKTFVHINDYEALRGLFGQLLGEIQRVRSEGDYEAGRDLIERYAVKVDPVLHKEVLDRYATLDIAPYKGFVNPVYTLVKDENGNTVDVKVDYGEGYADQMLRYSRDYSPLTKNK